MKNNYIFVLLTGLLVFSGWSADIALQENFEGALPDFHYYNATCRVDTARAYTGEHSLQVIPTDTGGAVYFKLDGKLDFSSDYEFTAWVDVKEGGSAHMFVSASDGKQRYSVGRSKANTKEGWQQLRGSIRAKDLKEGDSRFMLALYSKGGSWFDDVILSKTVLADPAIEVWQAIEPKLRQAADRHVTLISRGKRLHLDAKNAVLVPSTEKYEVIDMLDEGVEIGSDGVLLFAVEATEDLYLSGSVELEPDKDLRPGLQAYIHSDDTLIAAPMIRAEDWQNIGEKETSPAPAIQGFKPDTTINLTKWRVNKGRHYVSITGPHIRSAGVFRSLTLQALNEDVKKPLYTFAVFADTHLAAKVEQRWEWGNMIMGGPAITELSRDLESLRKEGVVFSIIAGDMVSGGRAPEIESLAKVIKQGGMPVYGCMGNHETFTMGVRQSLMDAIPSLFPFGKTQYVFEKSPLRFIVIDGCWWWDAGGKMYETHSTTGLKMRPKDNEIDWLKQTLAADTKTPTVIVWHFPFFLQQGISTCGYRLGQQPRVWDERVTELVTAAPNVVATINGHEHYNAFAVYKGVNCIQNAAYAEWPHLYRVFRVFDNKVEWEVRQVHNRGFSSEGVVREKAITWMVSTSENDLAGEFEL